MTGSQGAGGGTDTATEETTVGAAAKHRGERAPGKSFNGNGHPYIYISLNAGNRKNVIMKNGSAET